MYINRYIYTHALMDNQCIRDISADDPVDPGDLEEADLGIIDGGDGDHPLSASEEVTPRNGVHIPPFLNLNLDRDSGVDIPQGSLMINDLV